jgi:hypothetical protein
MKTRKNMWFGLFILCLILQANYAKGSSLEASLESDSVVIKKCHDFEITGNGNSDQWQGTGWINLVQQGQTSSSYQTKVKILYSSTGIYFLFNCEDKKITSTMNADNLNLWEEDVVEVFLWPDESFPVYFEY